jgi:hypothetical protein
MLTDDIASAGIGDDGLVKSFALSQKPQSYKSRDAGETRVRCTWGNQSNAGCGKVSRDNSIGGESDMGSG